jgi:xylulokinase
LTAKEHRIFPGRNAHHQGRNTPVTPEATGRLLNLRSNSTRAEVARTAVEGVLCGLLEGLDLLAQQEVRLDRRLILTGGAARSKAYQQTLADLTGKAIWIATITEAAAAGAGVQAAAALHGVFGAKIARGWAPDLELAAEPNLDFPREAIRERYRTAMHEHFAKD